MLLILLTFSFLIGSISTAIIICKTLNLPDPRTYGSNNPGATNVLRSGGKKVALFVLIGDGLKGAIPIFIAHYLNFSLFSMTLVAMAAFLGHVYPIFFNFKGGKGVATFLGSLLVLNYWAGLCFAIIWLFVAKVLKISSLSALVATLLVPICFYVLTRNLMATYVIIVICLCIFYTHRGNIKRLLSADEGQIKH